MRASSDVKSEMVTSGVESVAGTQTKLRRELREKCYLYFINPFLCFLSEDEIMLTLAFVRIVDVARFLH